MSDGQAITISRVPARLSDENLAALEQLLSHKSGLFLVRIHNYRVVKFARVGRETAVVRMSVSRRKSAVKNE